MLKKDEVTRISKRLSYVLRHNPDSIGIQLNEHGWTSVSELIEKLKNDEPGFDFAKLRYVVDTNSKKRFAFNDDFSMLRASQGHSIEIDLNYKESKPPAVLYHGTTAKFLPFILESGLQKMSRHHVHLSADIDTAKNVGARHGKPVILKINAEEMNRSGHAFYLSANNVWLSESVPVQFIEVLD